VERGQLRPHVGAVYSLADVPRAHALLQSPNNGLRGKIAIAIEPSLLSSAHSTVQATPEATP